MSRRLVMVGGWTDVYAKAKAVGFDLTVIQSREELKAGDLPYIDQLVTNYMEDPVVADIAAFLHGKRPFDAAVSFQELGIVNAAVIGERLGLAANPARPVLLTRDKGKMREHMVGVGLPTIPFVVGADLEAIVALGEASGWPLIVKPSAQSGSRQIHKVFERAGVAAALAAIEADFPGAVPISEKFIDGPEVSVEAFSWGGRHRILGMTDKITTGAPYFVETGHNMPSAFPPAVIEEVHALTLALLDAIGHQHGPTHTELIISADGPVIVESHTRTGGDNIFEMVELTFGVDMIKLMLEGLYHGAPELNVREPGGAAIRFLVLPEGTVRTVAGIEQARAMPGVVRCTVNLEPGKRVKPFKNSSERHGYVLAVGATGQEAIDNVEAAMRAIAVTVD
jgi:biotin carboxylase